MNNKQEVLPVNSKSKDRLFNKVYESQESRKNLAKFLLGRDFTDAKLKNVNSVAEMLELLKNRGVLCRLLKKKKVCDMTMATFSREDIIAYQGRELGREEGIEEGIHRVISNFLQNGGTKETAKQLLGMSEEQIEAAMSIQMQVAK